ncbi:Flavodoxin [Chlamydia trachomatis]|nr:Flavodoxin [Chlamydia trachomatis]
MNATMGRSKRTIVIYNTITGFSRTYANWIAQSLNADIYSLQDLCVAVRGEVVDLADYDLVIYGAGVRMHIIRGFKTFRSMLKKADLLGKGKVIVWANGGTPQHPDRDWKSAARTFTKNEIAKGEYSYFYLEGGVRYEGLNPAEKLLLKTFAKRVQKYRDRGEWAAAVADHIAEGYDHTRRDALDPLLARAREILAKFPASA